jgi:type IV fimbrial biogenesis protein FimT
VDTQPVPHLTSNDRIRGSRQRGFTLLELIVTMSIAAILLAIGIPSFRYVTTADRISGEVNSLLGDMQYARAEAIKEGQTITICAAATDDTSCSGADTWEAGWLVYSGNGTQPAASADILMVRGAFDGGDTFRPADGSTSAVQFNREGFAPNLAADPETFELHDPSDDATYTRCLALTLVGVPTTETAGQGACT